jgi:hypothetical protein
MNKLNVSKISSHTIKLCKIEADKQEFITAPLTIYKDIRMLLSAAKTIEYISNIGYSMELVNEVYKDTFN